MKTKIIFLVLSCFISITLLKAQNTISGITASYQYPELSQVQIAGMTPLQLQMERIILDVSVTITNAQDVSKLIVLLGTTEGSSDVVYKEFDYNTEGIFADGTSYSTSGNRVTLGLGTFTGVEHYYIEVAALMQDGTQTAAIRTVVE